MIVEFFLNFITSLLNFIFALFPNVPNLPDEVLFYFTEFQTICNSVAPILDEVIGGHMEVYFFFYLAIINFEHVWLLAMRVLSFFPVVGQGGQR